MTDIFDSLLSGESLILSNQNNIDLHGANFYACSLAVLE